MHAPGCSLLTCCAHRSTSKYFWQEGHVLRVRLANQAFCGEGMPRAGRMWQPCATAGCRRTSRLPPATTHLHSQLSPRGEPLALQELPHEPAMLGGQQRL